MTEPRPLPPETNQDFLGRRFYERYRRKMRQAGDVLPAWRSLDPFCRDAFTLGAVAVWEAIMFTSSHGPGAWPPPGNEG